jgi:hypothetical protein
LNGYAAYSIGGSLSCKDSLLIGWGGATDKPQDNVSCPIVIVDKAGGSLDLERCTIQLHPDSTHVLNTYLMAARVDAEIKASNCKFVGPAPGKSSGKAYGVSIQHNAAAAMVGGGVAHWLYTRY